MLSLLTFSYPDLLAILDSYYVIQLHFSSSKISVIEQKFVFKRERG